MFLSAMSILDTKLAVRLMALGLADLTTLADTAPLIAGNTLTPCAWFRCPTQLKQITFSKSHFSFLC
jgi:hypothetical protein